MIGVDSNILLRILLNDDPAQLEDVRELLEAARKHHESVWISAIVLSEVVWSLKVRTRWRRNEIAHAIEALLAADIFQAEHDDLVKAALTQYREGKADFPDYLIGQLNRAKGCRHTATFDRDLLGEPGFGPVTRR